MNWNQAKLPSLKRRGGCGINKKMRSNRRAADGVVRPAKSSGLYTFAELTTIYASRYCARASRPSARTNVASRYFWTAHPPLLFKEGNMLARQFIHIFCDRAYRGPCQSQLLLLYKLFVG